VARLQLIVPLLLWVIWLSNADQVQAWQLIPAGLGTVIYLLSLAAIVLMVRQSARRVMRRHPNAAGAGVARLHQTVFAARWIILSLHTFALFCLGFGPFIESITPTWAASIETVSASLSLIPIAAAWLGLVWAQNPLDRAVREQNALYAFEFGEPVYPIPTFRQQILAAFRLQILFTLVPVLLIALMRDVAYVVLQRLGHSGNSATDLLLTLGAMALIFILSPELLRRVLPTHRLPASDLRDRLEAMCRRLKLRYREILIWRTHHTVDNAAVMGIVPQVRYILLSDLLIATMTQDQIEAVFAHEAGHVKHRHMTWYLVFFITLTLALSIAGNALSGWHPMPQYLSPTDLDTLLTLSGIVMFLVLFGALSRSMERQADVFAAMAMTATASQDHPVGRDGVAVFCSALAKVARVNNMPLDGQSMAFGKRGLRLLYARIVNHSANWLHGSIRSRLDYLQGLVDNPQRLAAFNRNMLLIRLVLIAALIGTIAWATFA